MQDATRIITVTLNTAIDRVLQIDGLVPGEHVKATQRQLQPAGKGINVSRALGVMGHSHVATGFVGEESQSAYEASFAEMSEVKLQLLPVKGATRENITLLDTQSQKDTHLRLSGYEIGEKAWDQLSCKLKLLVHEGTVVVFCGSLPDGVSREQCKTLLADLQAGGGQLALDMNGDDLKEMMSLKPWLIKPNEEELAAVCGVDALSDENLAACLQEAKSQCEHLLYTRGKAGAGYVHGDLHLSATLSMDAPVVSTVGCGDCFMAGFISSFLTKGEPEAALRKAMAVAWSNTQTFVAAELPLKKVGQASSAVKVLKN